VGDTDVSEVWRDHRRWSNQANRLKRSIVLWRSTALALSIVGAVLATLATQVGTDTIGGRWASGLAAVALALVPIIRATWLGRSAIENWTRARSASEALKALVYLRLTWRPPDGGSDRDAASRRDAELRQAADVIRRDVGDLEGQTLSVRDGDAPVPGVTDVDSYVDRRVQPQIDGFYRRSAEKEQQRLGLFRRVEMALSLLGAALGAVAATTGTDAVAAWVAVVTTVGAAITAHIAAARYEHHVTSYLATARQLRFLVGEWRSSRDSGPDAAARFVQACEDVISRENESWMAAWSRNDGPA
jgi:hypothetical protein